jgi:hypothetical protein
VEDEKTPTTSEEEDVDAHLLRDKPGYEKPSFDAASEGDVEAHLLRDKPGYEKPSFDATSEEPEVEGHGWAEKPAAE